MKKSRLVCLIAIVLAAVLLLVACGESGSDKKSPKSTDKTKAFDSTDSKTKDKAGEEDLTPYTFTQYYNYEGWNLKEWGKDEVSKYLKDKFQIDIEFSKPDTDAQAKLNTMIASGDLPDSIFMDRNPDYLRMIELGLLQPLEPYMGKNPAMEQNLLESTREMLKVDGKLYIIPQWVDSYHTGGNMAWMYVDSIYKKLGSPKLETFDDLYHYACRVRDEVPETEDGLSVTPVQFSAGGNGGVLLNAFYRSFGGVRTGWYTVLDGKYQLVFRDPLLREVVMEVNKWWREGLISETQFTDSSDQVLEKMAAGRNGLSFYDQSMDDENKFRKIYMENHPGDSYEMVVPNLFPPAKGLSPDDLYGEWSNTIGSSGIVITTKAEKPQRIFDFRSFFYTPEAAQLLMYGPQGHLWDELDEDGLPILKKAENELTPDEVNALGLWFWMEPGFADTIDKLKFAMNEKMPPDKQSWVVSNQANLQTPTKWSTDEFVGVTDGIKPTDPEGINKTLVEDYIDEQLPKAMMADSEEKAEAMFDDILKFAEDNGIAAVEETADTVYQANVKKIGTQLTKGRYAQ